MPRDRRTGGPPHAPTRRACASTMARAWPTVLMSARLLLLDGDVELVLESHHELGQVEAVGVESSAKLASSHLAGLDGAGPARRGRWKRLEGVAHLFAGLVLVWRG